MDTTPLPSPPRGDYRDAALVDLAHEAFALADRVSRRLILPAVPAILPVTFPEAKPTSANNAALEQPDG